MNVCLSSSTNSPVDSYLCVYVIEALLKALKTDVPRDVAMCVIKSSHGCVYVCVCHLHSPVDSYLCVNVCMCMLTPLNDYAYTRQFLTVNYEVLCIKNSLVFSYNYTIQPHQ